MIRPPTSSRHAPRGFTLLETMLAAVIGAAVVAACVGVFVAMDRHERHLAARHEQVMALSRLHVVMQRAFATLVMSEHPRPNQPAGNRTTAGQATTPAASGSAATGAAGGTDPTTSARQGALSAGGAAGSGAAGAGTADGAPDASRDMRERARKAQETLATTLPARFTLASDPAVAHDQLALPRQAAHAPSPIQRLEVVLSKHPIPAATFETREEEAMIVNATARRDDTSHPARSKSGASDKASKNTPTDRASAGTSTKDDAKARLPDPTGKAVRGAFELRPTPRPPGRDAAPDLPRTWTLYWQPLAPLSENRAESERSQPPPTAEPSGPPVEIASGLTYAHWQVFRDRERRPEQRVLWKEDLPAYVEMEVTTVDGLWANWMFEVDWTTGPEGEATADSGQDGTDGAGRAGAGSDRPSSTPMPKVRTIKPDG